MKKFIRKICWFLLPVVLLHLFTFAFYNYQSGDLLRTGYIIDIYPNYRKIFTEAFNTPIAFTTISSKPTKKEFDVLTIGDSFSEQRGYGYQNYLSKHVSVLHIDRSISQNQIATLYQMVKGDFFDEYKVKFVVLQVVERSMVLLNEQIDTTKHFNRKRLDSLIALNNIKKAKPDLGYKFPSDRVLKFPLFAINYFTNNNYLFNDSVYKVQTTRKDLFSVNNNNLLFFHDDIKRLSYNNDTAKIAQLNSTLNKISALLNKKGIQLIVLPSPDKYDFYYQYIADKKKYPKPVFFEIFNQASKKYLYINVKSLLQNKPIKDLYFYDDTHWSPFTSSLVADEMLSVVKSNLK